MDADSSVEHVSTPAPSSGGGAVLPPAGENAPAEGMHLPSSGGGHSLLKAARIGPKAEQLALGTAGLASTMTRSAAGKLTSAALPAIAKALLRVIVPRLR